jgi:short-subunit dehydrogenase
MADEQAARRDFAQARQMIDVNFTSAVSILGLVAGHMEDRRHGWIAAVSSVAGDRGRQSNYHYGATKAALSAWLQGLRNRLHPAGVRVLTVKPGMVDTPMTEGVVDPRSPLVSTPERVAQDIDRAIRGRGNVLYTPARWALIMGVIRSLPECVFKRLRL